MAMNEKIKIFLLGMAVAFLAVITFELCGNNTRNPLIPSAHAADVAVAGDGTMAIAANDNLYLINTATKNIAYYSYKNAKWTLRGGRYYKFDLGLMDEFRDGGIPVKDAKKTSDDDAKSIRSLDN